MRHLALPETLLETLQTVLRIVGLAAVGLLAGCGNGSGLVEVTGTVTVDGKPAPSGVVSFVPEDGVSNSATGRINESGHFTMSTHEPGDGVKPGRYKVGVTIWKTPARGDASTGQLIPPTPLLPAKFMNPLTSGLTAEVKESPGSQTVDFHVDTDAPTDAPTEAE